MTTPGQNADDFDGVVAMATETQVNPENQIPVQAHATEQPITTPIQQHFAPAPVPAPVPVPAPEPVATEVKEPFDLDGAIDGLFKEFNIGARIAAKPAEPVAVPPTTDNPVLPQAEEEVENPIAKDEKMTIILEKLVTERDSLKDKVSDVTYERDQYKLTADKLHAKVSELIEQKTALEYDESKLEVDSQIKDLVHYYNKWSTDKTQQTPDSVLSKRTLAEATKVVEAITGISMDKYLEFFYLKTNPQIPKIGNAHSLIDYADPNNKDPKDRTFEEKKADPKWNPMEDRF